MSRPPPEAAAPALAALEGAEAGERAQTVARCDLAVLTPDLGLASETFIRRHCNELLPGLTAAVARTLQAAWRPEGPVLLMDALHPPKPSTIRRLARKLVARAAEPESAQYSQEQAEQFLRKHGVAVLLGEYLHWCVQQLPLVRRLGLPFWAHGHGYDVSAHLRNPRYQEAYRQFADIAGVVVVSEHSRRRLIELGLPAAKVHVVPCGTDVPQKPSLREAAESTRCLAVGRMVPKKGIILLLEAFRRAAEADPRLRLDLVGAGELFPAAHQFVQAVGMADRVILHGEQPFSRVRELLGQADIFVHHAIVDPISGDEEGLPVAILEAMAAGIPVVATRHAGIPEAVADGETGLLSAEGDSAAMAQNLLRLSRDASLRRACGEAAWARARQRFSWERERRDLLDLMGLGSTAGSGALNIDAPAV